jgi:glutamate racemase
LIGVFDSGVGGLSVWREIARCMPDVPLMYLADGAHVPYGARPLQEVRALTLDAAHWLIAQGCSMVVVACNTASAAALDDLRATFPRTPFVGMEPAVKPATLHTHTGVVGVLATAGTFKSQRYAELIARWANGVRVIERACSGWVELVERLEIGDFGFSILDFGMHEAIDHPQSKIENRKSKIREHVEPLLAETADVLVLGCTHFPFLAPAIEQVIAQWRATHKGAPAVRLIDPAPAVAQQTLRVWNETKNLAGFETLRGLPHAFFTTGDAAHFSRLASALLGRSVTATQASIQHKTLGPSS